METKTTACRWSGALSASAFTMKQPGVKLMPSDSDTTRMPRCAWCGEKAPPEVGTFSDSDGQPLCQTCWDSANEGSDDEN